MNSLFCRCRDRFSFIFREAIFNGLPWDGKFEASLQSLVVTRSGDARWFLVLMATPNYTGNVYELRVNLVPETKV